MNEPSAQQEEPEEKTTTPSKVWEQLSPDVQARVVGILSRMAYKYALAQRGSLSEEDGGGE
jgi:hypothetical protein